VLGGLSIVTRRRGDRNTERGKEEKKKGGKSKRRGERKENEGERKRERESERGATISKKIYVSIDELPKVGRFPMLDGFSIVTERGGARKKETGKQEKEKEKKRKKRGPRRVGKE